MAYLPERVAPSPLLTGQEYAKIQLMGWRSAWEPEVFFGYCALLQLDRSKLDLPIRHYSKGMGQKLALATILSAKKRLLLLDEPMSGLDPLAREQAQQALQYFHQQGGTLVISSHSMEDIRVLCSHAVVLDQGRLAFEGSIEAIDRMGQGSLMVALRQLTTSHQKEELA
jgi:ABC-2 type transport system ATP-binding protein